MEIEWKYGIDLTWVNTLWDLRLSQPALWEALSHKIFLVGRGINIVPGQAVRRLIAPHTGPL
jgi:hypothetical protein